MTNKQSWGEVEKLFKEFCLEGKITEVHSQDIIRSIVSFLTSKSEQMEGEKEEEPSLDELKTHTENCTCHIRRAGFNAGISKCLEILKK